MPDIQTVFATETQITRPRLPAPFWHLLLVVAYLVVPFQWLPWASKLAADLRGAGRIPIYFIELEFQWLFLAFVCIGVFFRNGRIRDLIGTFWKRVDEFLRDSGIGLLIMIINLMVIFALVSVFDVKTHGRDEFLPRNLVEFLAYAPFAITAGIGEEIIFRGYLQKQFCSMTGNVVVAVMAQAIIFALAHGYKQDLLGVIDRISIGIALGFLANARKSLLPGIMAHSFIDLFAGIISSGL
jgi:membrane protease YdiL (CAAX protease family)